MVYFRGRKIPNPLLIVAITAIGFFVYPHSVELFNTQAKGNGLLYALYTYAVDAEPLTALETTAVMKEETPLPSSGDIEVPFSPQAPFGDWGQPWQDACEETVVLMAVAWARDFELGLPLAAEEIKKQVAFEEELLGYHRDTTIEDTARLFTDFYHYRNIEVRDKDIDVAHIRQELAAGNVVIVPLDGIVLARENRYFTSPPHYHMVVVRGYDDIKKEFIVNEPGTKYGSAFRYSYVTLMDAIHDWTGSAETVGSGRKAMIVVRPVLPRERVYNKK